MSRFDVVAKLVSHPRYQEYLRGEKIMPVNVEISPSAECDAACPDCLYIQKGYSRSGFIVTGRLLDSLAEMEAVGVEAISWSGGGEPTRHPEFRVLSEGCGKMEQGLFTNALSVPEYDPGRFSWIRVTLSKNRHVPVDNIRRLRACKTVGLCVNYREGDDAEVQRALDAAVETGADYVQIRPALRVNGALVKTSPPGTSDPRVRVSYNKFDEAARPRGYDMCYGFHFVPFVWENGNVDVCGYMREHGGCTLGNIYEERFSDIMLRAPERLPVRKECQVCCKNHEINKHLNSLKNLEDAKFI